MDIDNDEAIQDVEQICSVEGCDRKLYSRTVCQAHYWRLKNHGDVQVDRPIGKRGPVRTYPTSCTMAGCDKKHYSKGLCATHYQKYRRQKQLGEVDQDLVAAVDAMARARMASV